MTTTTLEVAAPGQTPGPRPAPAVFAGEIIEHVTAGLPALAELDERDQLLLATWLVGLRSPRTRRAYLGDVRAWLDWLASRDIGVLTARRVHVDLWVSIQLANGAAASSVRRRLSALSRFYEHLATHDLIHHQPVTGVARPSVDPDHTDTIGLNRDQARALLTAAENDGGRAGYARPRR